MEKKKNKRKAKGEKNGDTNPNVSITNIIELNTSVKRLRLSEQIFKKQDLGAPFKNLSADTQVAAEAQVQSSAQRRGLKDLVLPQLQHRDGDSIPGPEVSV